MSDLYERLLKQRVSSLAADLARLQAEQDKAIRRRPSVTSPEQRRRCVERIVKAMDQVRQVERRLHHAKRLLAHAQGDEYVFAHANHSMMTAYTLLLTDALRTVGLIGPRS